MASTKYRTAEELNSREFNYYIAFGIELTEANVKNIEAAIIKKRNTFANDTNPTSQRLKDLKDDIYKIMLEDAIPDGNGNYAGKGGREQEAERAKKFYFGEAVEIVTVACENGTIFDTYISKIAKDYYTTEDEIIKAIQPLLDGGVKLIRSKESKRAVSCRDLEKVQNSLPKFGKKDIYDFLGLDKSSSAKELLEKNTNAYNMYSKKQGDPKCEAGKDLTGLIGKILKSDQGRREYDIFRENSESNSDVWKKLSLLKVGGVKGITDEKFAEYVSNISSKAAISRAEAEKELLDYLAHFQISLSSSNKLKFENCPHCGGAYVYKSGVKNCPTCGKSLEIKCWNCGNIEVYTRDVKPCAKCGISAKSKSELEKTQNALNLLLRNNAVTDVQLNSALNAIENVYPGYAKYPDSEVAKSITDAKDKIQKYKSERKRREEINEKYIKDIEKSIVQRKFCNAEAIVKRLRLEDPLYDTKAYEQRISAAKTQAQQYVDKANLSIKTNNESQAIELCCKALEICSDYTAATQMIKHYPPKQPGALSASKNGNSVNLKWQTVGDQRAVTYTILKKIGAAPASKNDGDVLATDLTSNYFEDPSAVSGVAYYYAVFASRGGVDSPVTSTTTPTILFLDVTSVIQDKVDGINRVGYQTPDNVVEVEVYKKKGAIPPMNRIDGQRIPATNTGFTDSALTETKNSYLIVCKYKYSGKEFYSDGVKISCTTFKFPKKLTNVSLSQIEGSATNYVFSCDQPINGKLKLYFSNVRATYQFGLPDDIANLRKSRDLREVSTVLTADNKITFSAPENSMVWLYPACCNDQLFVISEPILINTVVGIDAVNVVGKGGNVYVIEGKLNPKVRRLIAVISNTGYVDDPNAAGEQQSCPNDRFNQDKGFYLNMKQGVYYITLFAEFNEAGKVFYSKPTRVSEVIDNREKLNVEYELDYKPSTSTSFVVKVQFKCSEPITIPKVDLVSGYPSPLRKNNGVVIGTLNGGELKKKMFKDGYYYSESIKVQSATDARNKIVLFFNSNDEKRLRLKPVKI